ncbi:MAG: Omp28-related outer membrane protein, partial [Ignavibacteriaceae bacterium]|nr:Omp28-related outer membrane protein [Ignavibacteriaceae bacterium]
MNVSIKSVFIFAILIICFNTKTFPQTQRNPVLEYSAATWNQWQPCGDIIIEDILSTLPNAIILGYHGPANGTDPFSFFPGNTIISSLGFTAYPTGIIDRVSGIQSRGSWVSWMTNRNLEPAEISIDIDAVFEPTTREFNATIDFTALTNLSGQFKYNIILLEDSVVWEQTSNNTCTPGITFIPNYVNDNMVRDMMNGALGEEVINGDWNLNQTVSKSINHIINVPAGSVPDMVWDNCSVVVMIYKVGSPLASNAEIQQAEKFPLPDIIGTTITVTNPNGGEFWEVGTEQIISWQSNGVNLINLEYSTDNGTSWNQIANLIPSSDDYYNWTVPNTPSTECRVKIYEAGNPSLYDISDFSFNIFTPRFTFIPDTTYISGNIGDELIISVPIINMTPDPLTIYVAREINDLPMDWTSALCFGELCFAPSIDSIVTLPPFPDPPIDPYDTLDFSMHVFTLNNSGVAHIKLRTGDYYNYADTVYLDLYFFVEEIEDSIQVIVPNGGEIWEAGTTEQIEWQYSGVTNVKLEYTINNGATWTEIVNSYPASIGFFDWTIPNTQSTQCKIRISDTSNPSTNDTSDETFAIIPSTVPTVTVVFPNGGEEFETNQTMNILWTSENIVNIKIDISLDNGNSWNNIIANIQATTGQYDWIIPSQMVSEECIIRICDTTNPAICDQSNNVFSIQSNANIIVITPNGGESWVLGTIEDIKWFSENIVDVKIELSLNNGVTWNTIVD